MLTEPFAFETHGESQQYPQLSDMPAVVLNCWSFHMIWLVGTKFTAPAGYSAEGGGKSFAQGSAVVGCSPEKWPKCTHELYG